MINKKETPWINTYGKKDIETSFNNVNTIWDSKSLLVYYCCFLTCNPPLWHGDSYNINFYWRASVLNKIKPTWTETYRHELEFQPCLLCLPAREEPAPPNITQRHLVADGRTAERLSSRESWRKSSSDSPGVVPSGFSCNLHCHVPFTCLSVESNRFVSLSRSLWFSLDPLCLTTISKIGCGRSQFPVKLIN